MMIEKYFRMGAIIKQDYWPPNRTYENRNPKKRLADLISVEHEGLN